MSLHLLQSNFNEYLTLSAGSQQERDRGALAYSSEVSENSSQRRGFIANKPQGMQQSDVFKAEYVFIVDSEGEDEATSRKGEQSPSGGMGMTATRPKSLAISPSLVSDVVRPKMRVANLQASSCPAVPHGKDPQQKHGQVGISSCYKEKSIVYIPLFKAICKGLPVQGIKKFLKEKYIKKTNLKLIGHQSININNKFIRQKEFYNYTVS